MKTARDTYIYNTVIADGMKPNTAEFYIEMLQHFKVSDPVVSSSKKLAEAYGRSERTVQRYIKEITEQFNYIHKRPVWNNDNPDKAFIVHTIYSMTYHTIDILKKADSYPQQRPSVQLGRGV